MDIKTNHAYEEEVPKKEVERFWIGGYALLSIACLIFYFLFRLRVFELLGNYRSLLSKLAIAGAVVFVVLVISRFAEMLVKRHSQVRSLRYNAVRLIRLLTVLLVILVVISFLFQNWYTAAVSLGLISLLLGFALQTPISSLIAWFYIVFRHPYNIGDRIQINNFTGDVVEISYLDTTLWEFGGDYLTNDIPSGRLIRFPNSLVLESAVYNYSWSKFPYIWNEIPIHIAYESDLDFVEKTLRETTLKVLGPDTASHIHELKFLISKTPVDELEIKEYPYVSLRTNPNTWVEATVTYLAEPKRAATIRTMIIREILETLGKEPEKVMFPKGNNR